MAFDNPHYLWVLAVLPAYWLFAIRTFRKTRSWIYEFARQRKPLKPFLLGESLITLAVITVSVVLAGPRVQYEKTVFNRSGIDLLLGIDVSKSMLAEDSDPGREAREMFLLPNRLNLARYLALDLLSGLKGERVGAFLFSGNAVEIIPFTRDYGYCRYVIRHFNPADITIPGSDLGMAVRTGIAIFDSLETTGVKRMVLFSDGEDITPDTAAIYEAAKLAARKMIRIYTVGTGKGKGVLIPMRDESGAAIRSYYTDDDGAYVKTRLEPETLKIIAGLSGGSYLRESEGTFQALLNTILVDAQGFEETKSIELAWYDLSPLFLLAGLASLLAALLVGA